MSPEVEREIEALRAEMRDADLAFYCAAAMILVVLLVSTCSDIRHGMAEGRIEDRLKALEQGRCGK